jgi:hypothetical protein
MGLNLYGQLGLGTLANEPAPRRVRQVGGPAASVSCGDLHTLVLRADGRALSCGFNDAGRLGRKLDDDTTCADTLGALPLHAAVAAQTDALAVVSAQAGGAHTAIICADGSAYTCGRGECGQLGHGSTSSEALPKRISALKQFKIRRAALGQAHSLFLTAVGGAFACGCGGFGRLGLGGRENALVPTAVPSLASHVVVQISAGGTHSSFVTETGAVFLCGDDSHGQLGLDRGRPTCLEPTPPTKFDRGGVRVLGASCGGAHTAFLLRAVVDAKADYREDQVALAATVIESFFRGNHVRVLSDAVRARKRDGRADYMHTVAQRDAAAAVIQAGWRLKAADMDRARKEQLIQMRALRDANGEGSSWGGLVRRFDAAKVGKAFAEAGMLAAGLTRASW